MSVSPASTSTVDGVVAGTDGPDAEASAGNANTHPGIRTSVSLVNVTPGAISRPTFNARISAHRAPAPRVRSAIPQSVSRRRTVQLGPVTAGGGALMTATAEDPGPPNDDETTSGSAPLDVMTAATTGARGTGGHGTDDRRRARGVGRRRQERDRRHERRRKPVERSERAGTALAAASDGDGLSDQAERQLEPRQPQDAGDDLDDRAVRHPDPRERVHDRLRGRHDGRQGPPDQHDQADGDADDQHQHDSQRQHAPHDLAGPARVCTGSGAPTGLRPGQAAPTRRRPGTVHPARSAMPRSVGPSRRHGETPPVNGAADLVAVTVLGPTPKAPRSTVDSWRVTVTDTRWGVASTVARPLV